ncbi:MAG: hypothetical protein ACREU2_17570 [Steroidobacteraceae bacterium]
MFSKIQHETPALPVANYSSAISQAVEWLGDRYLLATPVNVVQRRKLATALGLSQHVWQSNTSFQRRYRKWLTQSLPS